MCIYRPCVQCSMYISFNKNWQQTSLLHTCCGAISSTRRSPIGLTLTTITIRSVFITFRRVGHVTCCCFMFQIVNYCDYNYEGDTVVWQKGSNSCLMGEFFWNEGERQQLWSFGQTLWTIHVYLQGSFLNNDGCLWGANIVVIWQKNPHRQEVRLDVWLMSILRGISVHSEYSICTGENLSPDSENPGYAFRFLTAQMFQKLNEAQLWG